MDKSFLSDQQLVEVSRDFVCLRLATYEDEVEAKYLKSIFSGRRSNQLENTVFAILTPDGKQKLSKSGRSPSWAFRDAKAMASWMKILLEEDYPSAVAARNSNSQLPLAKDFRLGLNIAACDQSLLLVVVGEQAVTRDTIQSRLLNTAWSAEFVGDFIYAAATSMSELEVKPGAYWMTSGFQLPSSRRLY